MGNMGNKSNKNTTLQKQYAKLGMLVLHENLQTISQQPNSEIAWTDSTTKGRIH